MFDFPLFPEQASSFADRIDLLYWAINGLASLITLIVLVFLIYFGVKYYNHNNVDRSNRVISSKKLEWGIVGLLTTLALATFIWSAIQYYDIYRPPRDKDALELFVVGRQWMWEVQHAEGKRELNELHVPLGRTIKVTASAEDVIHSFYVPAFRVKRDVLPGRYSTFWFRPTKEGRYHLFCTEYCGTEHSSMRGFVTVMKPAEYQRWLEQEEEEDMPAISNQRSAIVQARPGRPNSMVVQGEKLFNKLECNYCHGANAGIVAPSLRGIYGVPRPLRDGSVVMGDESYLRESILVPSAKVVQGYNAIMPPFQGQVTEAELRYLIEYIKYLGNPNAQAAFGDEEGGVDAGNGANGNGAGEGDDQ